jgi:hypothetical protein
LFFLPLPPGLYAGVQDPVPILVTGQLERAWDAWQAERYQRGETGQRPGYADNPFRPR